MCFVDLFTGHSQTADLHFSYMKPKKSVGNVRIYVELHVEHVSSSSLTCVSVLPFIWPGSSCSLCVCEVHMHTILPRTVRQDDRLEVRSGAHLSDVFLCESCPLINRTAGVVFGARAGRKLWGAIKKSEAKRTAVRGRGNGSEKRVQTFWNETKKMRSAVKQRAQLQENVFIWCHKIRETLMNCTSELFTTTRPSYGNQTPHGRFHDTFM